MILIHEERPFAVGERCDGVVAQSKGLISDFSTNSASRYDDPRR